jgi:amidase
MEITKAKLIAAGHSVIDFIPSEHMEASEIITKMWSADSGEEFQRDTDASGEPLHPHLESWLGHSAKAEKQSVFDTWQNQHKRALLAQRWLEKWQATESETGTGRPIDGLIMPSTPFPAPRHNAGYPVSIASRFLTGTSGYFTNFSAPLGRLVTPSGPVNRHLPGHQGRFEEGRDTS